MLIKIILARARGSYFIIYKYIYARITNYLIFVIYKCAFLNVLDFNFVFIVFFKNNINNNKICMRVL